MCGPGAADNALYYWPSPPNFLNNSNVYDNWDNKTSTWNGTDLDGVLRMRGYMMKLAWQIHAPSWPSGWNGMMNDESNRSYAVMLQTMRDGLNWEASGENASNWANYFYVVWWWNTSGTDSSTLKYDVQSDLYSDNVPVVAEVQTADMPNWNGQVNNHYVTIVGYDDNHPNGDGSYGAYEYTDTCASSTNCGSVKDGQLTWIKYSTMWTAITAIQPSQISGDGGWIW